MTVKLIWITGNAEHLIAQCARVSSSNPDNPEIEKLLTYMIRKRHWSPFEMANACFEIKTTRDIARQILRHRSFSFQEFSQRYAEVKSTFAARETRLQDRTNRQSSIQTSDTELAQWFENGQAACFNYAQGFYDLAIEKGIAKEQARVVLPEGLTPTHMYMNGTIRSWLHYLEVRNEEGTQKEHRQIATEILLALREKIPITIKAFGARKL